MEYPFENKQRKIRLLNLPFEVDNEEMIGEVVINSAFLKWIFHVASTGLSGLHHDEKTILKWVYRG